jgi:N-acetylglucosaminyldiphosphoundecaprenol N-acetyl-beta-D-mannosaminyltransferase
VVVEAFDRVDLDGTGIDRITEAEVVAIVRDALAHGRGGRVVTPNVDILRRAQSDPRARRYLDDADLVVADGMPLIWASRLGGTPLPERVAGSSLIWSLSQGLARDRRSIFVIGGAPAGRPGGGGGPAEDGPADGATRAADRLAAACPGLRIAGALCPAYGFERKRKALAELFPC